MRQVWVSKEHAASIEDLLSVAGTCRLDPLPQPLGMWGLVHEVRPALVADAEAGGVELHGLHGVAGAVGAHAGWAVREGVVSVADVREVVYLGNMQTSAWG